MGSNTMSMSACFVTWKKAKSSAILFSEVNVTKKPSVYIIIYNIRKDDQVNHQSISPPV